MKWGRMDWLSSSLLAGFSHGFTTRRGEGPGAAGGEFDLGGTTPVARADRIARNWEALRRATGLSFARARQVHGDRVLVARAAGEPIDEGDAVISMKEGVAACVSVADCVPILIGDPRSGAVAAVHAGWRGTLAHAAERAVETLIREAGADPADLLAAIGPAIGPCCYQVSEDLARVFEADLGAKVVQRRPGVVRLDLWLSNELVLLRAGLSGERIEVLGRCTACDPDTFFSYRRDGGRAGRQVGFIAPARGSAS